MLVDASGRRRFDGDRRDSPGGAQATGTSFKYLLATAQVESDLNPKAGAATSSARGLFQFIEQTWLGTLKQAGAGARLRPLCQRHHQAAVRALRRCTTRRCAREILKLRNDPTANAVMAGAFTQENAGMLAPHSAARRPRASSTSRISRRRRRRAADRARRRQPARQRRATFPGRREGQSVDLLRSAGQCPQRRRRCATFSPPLRRRARRRGARSAAPVPPARPLLPAAAAPPSRRRAVGSRRDCGPGCCRRTEPRDCCAAKAAAAVPDRPA